MIDRTVPTAQTESQRTARMRARVAQSGGKQVTLTLSAEHVSAMETIMKKHALSQADAIRFAIGKAAK